MDFSRNALTYPKFFSKSISGTKRDKRQLIKYSQYAHVIPEWRIVRNPPRPLPQAAYRTYVGRYVMFDANPKLINMNITN